jgi:hypothetical protein
MTWQDEVDKAHSIIEDGLASHDPIERIQAAGAVLIVQVLTEIAEGMPREPIEIAERRER